MVSPIANVGERLGEFDHGEWAEHAAAVERHIPTSARIRCTRPGSTVAKRSTSSWVLVRPEGDADVAVGEYAHRCEHVRRAERARQYRLSRSRRRSPRRPARSPAPRRRRTGRRRSVRAAAGRPGRRPPRRRGCRPRPDGAARRSRRGAACRARPPQSGAPAEQLRPPGAAGTFGMPGGEAVLPLVHRPGRREPSALPYCEQPDPRRPAPLVSTGRQAPTTQPVLRRARPRRPRPRRAARPPAAQTSAAQAIGCRVPTSWFADCSAATATPGLPLCAAKASWSTRPERSTPTSAAVPAAAAACSTAECSTAVCTTVCPDPAAGGATAVSRRGSPPYRKWSETARQAVLRRPPRAPRGRCPAAVWRSVPRGAAGPDRPSRNPLPTATLPALPDAWFGRRGIQVRTARSHGKR